MSDRSVAVVATLGVLAAAAAATVVATSDHVLDEVATIALAVPTGLAFIGSGIVARRRRPANDTGVLMILVGFAWFLAALPSADHDLLFTAGFVFIGLFIGFLAHLLLSFPSGRLESRIDRWITGAMYVVVALPPFGMLLDEGDLSETACETGAACPDNLLAIVPGQTAANVLAAVYGIGTGALSVAVAVRLVLRWRRATPALRRALNPVVVAAAVLIGAFALQIVVSALSEDVARGVNWFLLTAMLALPLAFLYGLLRPRLTASARRLAAELAEQRRPEEIQDVLRRWVRDPTLRLGYRDPAGDGYVGVDRRPLELPEPGAGRAVTRFADDVIVHDASLLDQPELDEVVDAVHIALERGVSLSSLEESERRGRALVEAIPDNVYRIAADGTYLDVHVKGPTIVFGLDVSSLVGRNLYDVLPTDFADALMAGLRRALESGEMETVEYRVEQATGAKDAEIRVVRSGPEDVVMIVRDVTDRKTRERELRALLEEQEALSRVAVAVVTETQAQRLFDVVSEEVGQLVGAQGANLARFEPDPRHAVVLGRWGEAGAHQVEIGQRLILDGATPLSRVRATGRPVRFDSLDDIRGERAAWMRSIGIESVVAAPVHVGGRLWGAVVASRTEEQPFSPGAEQRVEKFAALVAIAIANAEAREGLARAAEEQAALSRVAIAVATGTPSETLFNVVTEEVGRLFGAEWAETARFADDGSGAVSVGTWAAAGRYPFEPVGTKLPWRGGPLTRVFETRRPARVDADADRDQRAHMTELGVASAVSAPIFVGDRLWGGISLGVPDERRFAPGTEERLAQFTALLGLAIVNAETRAELAASRARIVHAGDEERRRLERNLHDGAQQRLVALSLALRLAQAKLDDPDAARAVLDGASQELAQALEDLRELARGIHPAILSDRGLAPALEALAARSPFPVELERVDGDGLPAAVEAAAYYVVAESLTNTAKYAEAQAARVRVERRNGLAIVEVEDDGVGGADVSSGTGLRGLADRVEALEGRLTVTSEDGRGTTVRAEIPLTDLRP